MASEKRLIDAYALDKKMFYAEDSTGGHGWVVALEDIVNAPTVDAVEVVRCKDCKSYDPGYIRPYCGWCSTWETAVRESGYCHHGERKE